MGVDQYCKSHPTPRLSVPAPFRLVGIALVKANSLRVTFPPEKLITVSDGGRILRDWFGVPEMLILPAFEAPESDVLPAAVNCPVVGFSLSVSPLEVSITIRPKLMPDVESITGCACTVVTRAKGPPKAATATIRIAILRISLSNHTSWQIKTGL